MSNTQQPHLDNVDVHVDTVTVAVPDESELTHVQPTEVSTDTAETTTSTEDDVEDVDTTKATENEPAVADVESKSTDEKADKSTQDGEKSDEPTETAQPRLVSSTVFSTTIHKPGQPAVHFVRKAYQDEHGHLRTEEERRIGNKKAVTLWDGFAKDVKHDVDVNTLTKSGQTTYENVDEKEFEATWASVNNGYATIGNGSGSPTAKIADEDTKSADQELPVLGSPAAKVVADEDEETKSAEKELPVLSSSSQPVASLQTEETAAKDDKHVSTSVEEHKDTETKTDETKTTEKQQPVRRKAATRRRVVLHPYLVPSATNLFDSFFTVEKEVRQPRYYAYRRPCSNYYACAAQPESPFEALFGGYRPFGGYRRRVVRRQPVYVNPYFFNFWESEKRSGNCWLTNNI